MWISLFTLKCLEQRPSHPARTLCPEKGGFVWPQNSGWLGQWHHPGGCTSRPCRARNSIHFFFRYTRVWNASQLLHDHYPAPLPWWEEAHTHLWLFHWVKSSQEKLIRTQSHKMTPNSSSLVLWGSSICTRRGLFEEANDKTCYIHFH